MLCEAHSLGLNTQVLLMLLPVGKVVNSPAELTVHTLEPCVKPLGREQCLEICWLSPTALRPILLICIISGVLEALWFKDMPQKFCYVPESSLHCQHSLEEASLSCQTYNAGSPPGPCREQSATLTVKDVFSELEHLLRYLDYGFRYLDYKYRREQCLALNPVTSDDI